MTQAQKNLKDFAENSCKKIKETSATAANNINDLSDEIHIAIGKAQEFSQEISNLADDAFSEFDDFSRQAVQSMQEVSKRIETTSYKQREIMDAEIQATKDAVQKTTANIENEIFKITKTVANSMHKLTEENNKDLQTISKNLSNDLTQKMNDCLTNFGKAMNLVAQKFVEDYTPLTQKLALLINIAKDAERRAYSEKIWRPLDGNFWYNVGADDSFHVYRRNFYDAGTKRTAAEKRNALQLHRR